MNPVSSAAQDKLSDMSMPKPLAAPDVYTSAYRSASDATRLFGCNPRLCHVTRDDDEHRRRRHRSTDVFEGLCVWPRPWAWAWAAVIKKSCRKVEGVTCRWAGTALLRVRLLSPPLGSREAGDTTRTRNKHGASGQLEAAEPQRDQAHRGKLLDDYRRLACGDG